MCRQPAGPESARTGTSILSALFAHIIWSSEGREPQQVVGNCMVENGKLFIITGWMPSNHPKYGTLYGRGMWVAEA